MPGTSPRPSTSASNSPHGTGTSSTWCGCSCSSASMSGATAPKPWRTARIDPGSVSGRSGYRFAPKETCQGNAPKQKIDCATRGGLKGRPFALPSPARGEGKTMPDPTLPTVTESALRGLACKCPRCGKGKLYAGFLNLRPRCEVCGLDFAFIDTGDGPAIFIIMLAGAIVVGCALIVEVKYQPPYWLHAVLWLPLILATTLLPLRAMKSLLIALPCDG